MSKFNSVLCPFEACADMSVPLKLGFPFERGRVEIHGGGSNAKEFVQNSKSLCKVQLKAQIKARSGQELSRACGSTLQQPTMQGN